MKKYILIFCLTILCAACHSSSENVNRVLSAGVVVIQFKNPPHLDNFLHFTKKMWVRKDALISIFANDRIQESTFELTTDSLPEEIKVSTLNDFILFRHNINYLDYKDYIFKKGDSVMIEYDGCNPLISVKNRKTLPDDYHVEDFFQRLKGIEKYSAMAKFENALAMYGLELYSDKKRMQENQKLSTEKRTINRDNHILRIKKTLSEANKAYIKASNNILDSLHKKERISETTYHFYKNKLAIKDVQIDTETDQLDEKQITEYLRGYQPNSYGYPDLYYQDLIKAVRNKFITSRASFKEIPDGTNKDSKEVFDMITASAIFPEKDRAYLLTREINKIAQLYPKADFLTYFAKYEKEVKDTTLINPIKEDFAILLNKEVPDNRSMTLLDKQENKISLEDLLKKHKGKVVYVDFWASWCKPCRQAIPHSKKLKETLNDIPVVFVYLSIDSMVRQWKQASVTDKLADYTENYLVFNWEESAFIKKYKISSIPRYMIFDKDGQLVDAMAPGPVNEDAEEVLRKLAKAK